MSFSFKAFHVDDHGCGQPVTSDSVLLGCWAPLEQAQHILDIGAGSGLLSLMAAQRSQALVDAVELDNQAADACRANFSASPWPHRLHLHHGAIQQFVDRHGGYDHILCNPPYFDNGPLPVNDARSTARHTHTLAFAELARALIRLLRPQGLASLILPCQSVAPLQRQLHLHGLQLLLKVDVIGRPGKAINRQLLLVGNTAPRALPLAGPIYMRDAQGQHSPQMRQLAKDFYLKL